ncbi:MAG: rod shape-determining protein RodA [Syntrophomonadaceae bacterium]|nr:rod shape-determining protein RodA [Syntrophomonadaceae bacterium]
MISRRTLKVIDKPFLLVLTALIVFGLVVLTSASSDVNPGAPYIFLQKQLLSLVLGLVLIIFILNIDYTIASRYNRLLYLGTNLLLILVLVLGTEMRGSQGWISIGGLNLQVAEFAKILIILCFADFLSKRQGMLNTLREMMPCFLYMGLPFLLIMLQPDLGTALVFLAITMGMMFVAGANPKILVGIIVGGLGVIILALFLHAKFGMWLPLEEYQLKRLTVFVDPYNDGKGGRGAGWNIIQSLVAIGSGGLFGKGMFQGTQAQLNFLPEHHTDFIFAVVGEEFGFVGAALLLLLFAVLLLRCIYIAYNAKDFFSTLVVMGIISMWLFHICENIGMSIGLLPVTGVPLPFISYGASFMLANMIAIGILISINVKGRKIVF